MSLLHNRMLPKYNVTATLQVCLVMRFQLACLLFRSDVICCLNLFVVIEVIIGSVVCVS
jgi:hypothetical protein